MREKILINKIRCNHCKDELESISVHDFKRCNCGKVCVDGGREYLKRCFVDIGDYEDLSITEEIKDNE